MFLKEYLSDVCVSYVRNVTKYMYSTSVFMQVLKFSIDSWLILIDSDECPKRDKVYVFKQCIHESAQVFYWQQVDFNR